MNTASAVLRRVILRSNMTQVPLNQIMVPYAHKENFIVFHYKDVAKDFVACHDHECYITPVSVWEFCQLLSTVIANNKYLVLFCNFFQLKEITKSVKIFISFHCLSSWDIFIMTLYHWMHLDWRHWQKLKRNRTTYQMI